jgi:hypothetical protein
MEASHFFAVSASSYEPTRNSPKRIELLVVLFGKIRSPFEEGIEIHEANWWAHAATVLAHYPLSRETNKDERRKFEKKDRNYFCS